MRASKSSVQPIKRKRCKNWTQDLTRNRFGMQFFIDASSEIVLEKGYIQIAAQNKIDQTVSAVRSWLSNQSSTWMLVLDDVCSCDIGRYLPATPEGCLVIMTSADDTLRHHATAGVLKIKPMSMTEAVQLFQKTMEKDLVGTEEQSEASKFLDELGNFPLAIDLAGCYIKNYCLSIAEYRGLLKDELELSLKPDIHKSITGYDKSLFGVRNLTFKKITKAEANHTVSLLKFFSLLHAQQIPTNIVLLAWKGLSEKGPLVKGENLEVIEGVKNETMAKLRLCAAVDELACYSIVDLIDDERHDTRYISIPSLFHTWIREMMSEAERQICWRQAISAVAAALETEQATPKDRHEMLPYVDHLLNLYRANLFEIFGEPQKSYYILFKFSDTYSEVGFSRRAKVLRELLCEKVQKFLPEDIVRYAQAAQQLARSYSDLGEYKQALKVRKEIISRLEIEMHGYSLLFLSCWIDLSDSLEENNELEDALEERKQILKQYGGLRRDQNYRAELDRVSRKLAVSERDLGDTNKSLSDMRECVRLQKEYLQEHDHELLVSITELARCYESCGESLAALELFAEVLRKREDGCHTNQDILAAKEDVAAMHTHRHAFNEALRLREEILGCWEELQEELGDEHPNFLKARSNLARSLADCKQYDRSLAEHQEVFQSRRRQLGCNNPATIDSKYYMALTARKSGKTEQALDLFVEVVNEWDNRKTGRPSDHHREKSFAKNELANTYRDLKDLEQALSLRKSWLKEQLQLDPDQRKESTLLTMKELVVDYARIRKNETAIAEGKQALRLWRNIWDLGIGCSLTPTWSSHVVTAAKRLKFLWMRSQKPHLMPSTYLNLHSESNR